ncbi:MAG: vanadium-dependent haloperoxidase [Candidatus Rokuibacteriota bacterium]
MRTADQRNRSAPLAGAGGGPALGRRDLLRAGLITAAALGLDLRFPSVAYASFPSAESSEADVAIAWYDQALRLIQQTPGYTPPVAARALAYLGVSLFESLVPGIADGRSLAGQVRDLPKVPTTGRNTAYDWNIVANSTLASITRSLFPSASAESRAAIDSLEAGILASERHGVPLGVVRRSVDRGGQIAAAVYDWSRTDGGHGGFADNFPPYVAPLGPGLWEPTPPAFLPALQPYWGSCRTFATASGAACPPGPATAYDEDPGSRFFEEASEVYAAVNGLTDEQSAIAMFWSDDPGATVTPPGHSVSILTQTLRLRGASLAEAAIAYAKVGMAVADAFICCWHTKFQVNLLRPVTYIRALIDPAWSSPLTTPPFPEFTSGHSVQSGAAATVLTDLFGDGAFTDHTHDDRGLPSRSFRSFWDAADEAAISRLYGGIHFRPAIELGLEQGRCVGEHVNALRLRG